MEYKRHLVAQLKMTTYSVPSVKNGISYQHKLSVLWLNYTHNSHSFMVSLN